MMAKKNKKYKVKRIPVHEAILEFLTTYGWAIIVLAVMIGALAYFGALKPADKDEGRSIENELLANSCLDICDSHNYDMNSVRKEIYQNPVCYCTEETGEVLTFIM